MPFNPEICYSHSNGNLLSAHLFYVGKAMCEMLPYNKDIAFLLGVFHDFGKLTSFYQKFIQSKINNEPLLDVANKQKTHTALGALFCLYFFDKYLDDSQKELLPAILNCVFHHSPLSDIEALIIENKKFNDENTINIQIEDLRQRKAVIDIVYKNELCDLIIKDKELEIAEKFIKVINTIDFDNFLIACNNRTELLRPVYLIYRKKIKEAGDPEAAFFTTALFGALINADRELADVLPEAFFHTYHNHKNLIINTDIISEYVHEKFGENDKFKSLVFQTVSDSINDENIMKYNIFNITAPTGSGKTETSLNFAFKLKAKINAQRIIYALPLTNVLEQNYERLHKIFSRHLPEYKGDQRLLYLLKYHYLANYDNLLNENDSLGEVLKNAERLQSEVVITTYIQVLYALISNSPHFLSRFPLFNNAILLFDEPQVLSPDHWLLIKHGFKLLTDNFNCKIILLTATKPLIFKETECYELTQTINFKEYSKNRTALIPSLDVTTFNDLLNMVIRLSKEYRSILIVLNTIKSSIEFFNILKENPHLRDYNIFYLSTNLIPIHRQEIIEKISLFLEEKRKVILVSTQVIEAGVEFDFGMGIRDLATFDSIVQTAGRVNRKGEEKISPLYIINLQHEKTKRDYSSFIYHKDFLKLTQELLSKKSSIEELLYPGLTEKYFEKISDYMNDFNSEEETDNAYSSYKRMQFEALTEKFKIVEDEVERIPVLVPYDEQIAINISNYIDVLNQYKNAKYEDKWELKRLLSYAKRKIIPYLINISSKSLNAIKEYLQNENDSKIKWARVIDKNLLEYCYEYDPDKKIGQGIILNSESESLWI